jgi:hypothetical protein
MQNIRSGEGLSDSEEEEEEDEGGPRRSRRATKGQRVKFWKNERPVYVKGKMVGLLQADPTPAKPKTTKVLKKRKKSSSSGVGKKKRLFDGDSSDATSDEDGNGTNGRRKKQPRKNFPASQLPNDVNFISRKKFDSLAVWDDVVTAPAK